MISWYAALKSYYVIGCQKQRTANFLGTSIISETGKATDFKLGQYIHGVIRKNPTEIFEKEERGRDCPNFGGIPHYLGTGKATDFKFGK